MVPYIPVRSNIFHMLPDLVENLRSLIASQYTEADRAICGRGNFILRLNQKHRLSVADWKALSERQRQRVRHAVFSLACKGVAGTQQSTSTDGSLTILHRPESRRWEETGKSSSTNSTQLNSTENYGRRCLTPLSPHRNYILS